MCQEGIDYYPQQCNKCGVDGVDGTSTQVYRHQIVEVLPVEPIVIAGHISSEILSKSRNELELPQHLG